MIAMIACCIACKYHVVINTAHSAARLSCSSPESTKLRRGGRLALGTLGAPQEALGAAIPQSRVGER